MSGNYKTGEGIHLVQFPHTDKPTCNCHRVGERVPYSGIYRALHDNHRLSHEVTLLAGQVFPRCNKCGLSVHFELVQEAPAAIHDRDFRVQLYEIPHPETVTSGLQHTA